MDHSARELRRQRRTLGLLALFSLRGCVAHVAKPDRETALRNLAIVFDHYNEQHPHSALDYRSPREFRRLAAASI